MASFGFSFGRNQRDNTPEFQEVLNFEVFVKIAKRSMRHGALELAQYLGSDREVRNREKDGPWFVLGKFIKPSRKAEDLEYLTGFACDFDCGMTMRKIEEIFDGYKYVTWTTYSHSPKEEKRRLVLPFERPVEPVRHDALFAHFQGLCGGMLDKSCRKPAQIYYFPGCPEDALDLHEFVAELNWVFFDPDEVRAATVAHATPQPAELERAPVVGSRWDEIKSALECVLIPQEDNSGRRELWRTVGMALHHESAGDRAGLVVWREWHRANRYDRNIEECDDKWASFGKSQTRSGLLTARTIFDLALKAGWRKPEPNQQIGEVIPIEFSEDGIANDFLIEHGEGLRYVATWKKWFKWVGTHWQEEKTHLALDLVGSLCREKSREALARADMTSAKREKIANSLARTSVHEAIERRARVLRGLAATSEQWDQDLERIAMGEVTVDLTTGEPYASHPEDYITRLTAVAPGRGECPMWMQFLEEVQPDSEVRAYLQRLMGYCLTGLTTHHMMAFFYGTGANGKSTFLNTVAGIMGDYAITAPADTFIESRGERHPAELAMMRGARLVVAQETEEGRRWAEAKIKALTGGDPITARFMHKDFFTYTPQFKLVISGNHRPLLRNVDEGMKRRMHIVPWAVTIAPEKRDPELPAKLRAEWPQIMAWMVRGVSSWRDHGLEKPRAVEAATEDYMTSQDVIRTWLDECCEVGAHYDYQRSWAYDSYARWAQQSGEAVMAAKRFYDRLEADYKFQQVIVRGTRFFRGFRGKGMASGPNLKSVNNQ